MLNVLFRIVRNMKVPDPCEAGLQIFRLVKSDSVASLFSHVVSDLTANR